VSDEPAVECTQHGLGEEPASVERKADADGDEAMEEDERREEAASPVAAAEAPARLARRKRAHPSSPEGAAARIQCKRQKKPWESCGPTQKWERVEVVKAAAKQMAVPLSAVIPAIPLSRVVAIPQHKRRVLRLFAQNKVPCEQRVAKYRRELAETFGTKTRAFVVPEKDKDGVE
jgi:hypothetical protein